MRKQRHIETGVKKKPLGETTVRFPFARPSSASMYPSGTVRRIDASQLSAWVRLSFATIPVGVVVALALAVDFREWRWDRWIDIGIAGLLASYAVLLAFCVRWTKHPDHFFVNSWMRSLLLIRLLLGSFWAWTIVSMAAVADPMQRSLLDGTIVGLMSTSIFGGPAIYALSYWLPMTVGAFAALFATGQLTALPIATCVSAYAALTFFGLMFFDRQFVERSMNMLRLEQHADTIGILLRDFEESSSDWLWETDQNLIIRHPSSRFAEAAGRDVSDMAIGLFTLLGESPADNAETANQGIAILRERIAARFTFRELVVPVMVSGEPRWWALTGRPLFASSGSFVGYRGVGSDVTTAHTARERISYLARHDTLTGLANRTEFNDVIATVMSFPPSREVALLCLDLDGFKAVNDSYGHGVGDALLRDVAQRIKGAVRDGDLVARLGGDEFIVLLKDAGGARATSAAGRIVDSFSVPFKMGDIVTRIGVSIGIALAPTDGHAPDELYRNADLALYRAKSGGRGTWILFDPEMDGRAHEQWTLQQDLRDAIEGRQLFVVYQPIVDLETRMVIGLEALVRWSHPQRGLISPADFVPVSERIGLIGALGAFVLAEAAALAARLPPDIHVAVNLSPLQLRDCRLVDQVDDIMQRAGVAADQIEFEITESFMLETHGRSMENLGLLRDRGFRVAIDDFGTGYSSLAALRSFPFDRLKIDRSFITDLAGSETEGRIVKAIISLARTLGISVIAEGIETEQQAQVLQEYGCANGQGYLFAHPLSVAEVMDMLAKYDDMDLALVPRIAAPPSPEPTRRSIGA